MGLWFWLEFSCSHASQNVWLSPLLADKGVFFVNERVNQVWGVICIICAMLIALFLFSYTPAHAPSNGSSFFGLLQLVTLP